jgi:type III pantothenate kinase
MSPPGRPKGESLSAPREGSPVSWLLIDAGNTAVKWTTAAAAGPADRVERLDNAAPTFEAQLAAAFAAAAARPGSGSGTTVLGTRAAAAVAGPVAAAVGCCVASDAVRAAIERAVAASGVALTWLQSQAGHAPAPALVNRYRDYTQLGADRWHAMLGARGLHPERALVVVHAGTATTIDCVSADGSFVGGAILPGTELMLDALARRTARLPHARGAAVAFPDNTDDAIATGIADAQAGAVERMVARFARQAGGAVTVLLGGGAAAALRARLQLDPAQAQLALAHNLVLRGLWRRARETAP